VPNKTYKAETPAGSISRFIAKRYDRLAAEYDAQRRRGRWPMQGPHMRSFFRHVPKGGAILDLGCGAGYPVARKLTDMGYQVTGLDLSKKMLALARKAVPEGRFVLGDMASPGLPKASFDGAVAFYSFFHVSWRRHPKVLRAVRRLLKPGRPFLFCLGIEMDREYTEEYMGTRMYWSSPPLRETLKMLRDAGFGPVWRRPLKVGGEGHMWFVARAAGRKRS
jgi:ubiquinone/menaquinone biosynthesis C-methylase UbiE